MQLTLTAVPDRSRAVIVTVAGLLGQHLLVPSPLTVVSNEMAPPVPTTPSCEIILSNVTRSSLRTSKDKVSVSAGEGSAADLRFVSRSVSSLRATRTSVGPQFKSLRESSANLQQVVMPMISRLNSSDCNDNNTRTLKKDLAFLFKFRQELNTKGSTHLIGLCQPQSRRKRCWHLPHGISFYAQVLPAKSSCIFNIQDQAYVKFKVLCLVVITLNSLHVAEVLCDFEGDFQKQFVSFIHHI